MKADLSFVMKAGISRLSTCYACFSVDLNPGNWKSFSVILVLVAALILSVDLQ